MTHEPFPTAEPSVLLGEAVSSVDHMRQQDNDSDPFAGVVWINSDAITDEIANHSIRISVGGREDAVKWNPVPTDGETYTVRDHFRKLARPVPGEKNGPGSVPGNLFGTDRKSKAIEGLYLAVLDSDGGKRPEEIADAALKHGILCLIHPTYSDRSQITEIDADRLTGFEVKHGLIPRSNEAIRRFLIQERSYEVEIADTARFREERQAKEGLKVFVDHAPMRKVRVVTVLKEPYFPARQAQTTHNAGMRRWGNRLRGLAQMLGLSISMDRSCVDPARFFFSPRHPPGVAPMPTIIVGGNLLDFESVAEVDPAGKTREQKDKAEYRLASGFNLVAWAGRSAAGWQVADLIEEFAPDRIRQEIEPGKLEIECPFDSFHSDPGNLEDRACCVVNAAAGGNEGGFRWTCQHGSCRDRDRLAFVAMAFDEWGLPETALTDERFDALHRSGEAESRPGGENANEKAWTTTTALSRGSDHNTVVAAVRAALMAGIVGAERTTFITKMAEKLKGSGHNVTEIRGYFAKAQQAMDAEAGEGSRSKKAREKADEMIALGLTPIFSKDDGARTALEETRKAVSNASRSGEYLFQSGPKLVRVLPEPIRESDRNRLTVVEATARKLNVWLPDKIAYLELKRWDEDEYVDVPPPAHIAPAMLEGAPSDSADLPRLHGLFHSPVFIKGPNGAPRLIAEPGYSGAGYIYDPAELDLGVIDSNPTSADLDDAKQWIFGEAVCDFPFDDGRDDQGRGESSKAHFLAALLQLFTRPLIDGPTPAPFVTKPEHGTGASLLLDVMSLIATGQNAPMKALPESEEEVIKTLIAEAVRLSPMVVFDNVRRAIESETIAMALTSSRVSARLLGGNEIADVPWRALMAFTGNNIQSSHEMARRLLPVRLDAKGDPLARDVTAFRHPALQPWVRENRAALVRAVLTFVNYWAARDAPLWSGKPLPSFEGWSGIIGGILQTTGVPGFLGNLHLSLEGANQERESKTTFVSQWLAQDGFDNWRTIGDPDDDMDSEPKKSLVTIVRKNEIDIEISGRDGSGLAHSLAKKLRKEMIDNQFTVDTDSYSGPVFVRAKKLSGNKGFRYCIERAPSPKPEAQSSPSTERGMAPAKVAVDRRALAGWYTAAGDQMGATEETGHVIDFQDEVGRRKALRRNESGSGG